MIDWFRVKDDPTTLRAWEGLKEQWKGNVDEYTKFKRPATEVQRFYADSSIFVTGATGFMGKCFVEKILRDCPDLKHLYILVRAKKSETIQGRMSKYFNNKIFDRLRKIQPNFEDKVVLVNGDLFEQNLGLSAEDRQMLIENIDIMVHNGATVKFNERVSVALKINVLGTRDILELALACKHMKAFAYVSTAYSHCYMKNIQEEFHAPPADLKTIYDLIAADQATENGLSEESMKKFLGKWPNVYTFTKAVSEDLVRQYGEKANFACCVFRPSMVIAAIKEPFIGWVGNNNGPNAALVAGVLGFLHVLLPIDILDMVPVDYSINALIISIYDVVKQWNHESQPKVYNFGSSVVNPAIMKELCNYVKAIFGTVGSIRSVWHPSLIYTTNKWEFYVLHYLLHGIPAIIADIVLIVMRKKPRAVNIFISATKNLPWLLHYSNFGWRIQVTNTRKAFERITNQDKELFDFNIWNMSWKDWTASALCGGKIFTMKESFDDIEKAKRRFVLLRGLHYAVLTVFYFVVIYCFMKLICRAIF